MYFDKTVLTLRLQGREIGTAPQGLHWVAEEIEFIVYAMKKMYKKLVVLPGF